MKIYLKVNYFLQNSTQKKDQCNKINIRKKNLFNSILEKIEKYLRLLRFLDSFIILFKYPGQNLCQYQQQKQTSYCYVLLCLLDFHAIICFLTLASIKCYIASLHSNSMISYVLAFHACLLFKLLPKHLFLAAMFSLQHSFYY